MPKEGEQNMEKATKPSVEEIRGLRETLGGKIAEAELKKEEHIKKMLVELDGLGAEREQNKELLTEAGATLSYYIEMEKAGKLDEEDVKSLADIKKLISDLEEQKGVIDTSMAEIKANPDVAAKLKEKEAAEFKIKEEEKIKKKELLKETLTKEFVALAEDIRALGYKKYLLDKQIKDAENAESEAREKVKETAKAENDTLGLGSPLRGDLRPYDTGHDGGYGGYFDKLQELRGRLGFWDFRSKRAIDNILSQKALFDEVGKKDSALIDLKESLKPVYEKIAEEAKKLQEIYSKIRWEKNSALFSSDDGQALIRKFFSLLRSFADIERADPDNPSRMLVGNYHSWGAARADLKNNALYNVLYMIDERADY